MSNHPLIRLLVVFVIAGVIFFGVKHSKKDTLICTYKGTQMSWTKCKDQLPEDGEMVLVANTNKPNWEVTVGELSAVGWRALNAFGVIESTAYFSDETFTHWMPLPENLQNDSQ